MPEQRQVRLATPEDIQKFGGGSQVQVYAAVSMVQSCWTAEAIGVYDNIFYVDAEWAAVRKPIASFDASVTQWVRRIDKPALAFDMEQLEVSSEGQGQLELYDHDGFQFLTILAPGHELFISADRLYEPSGQAKRQFESKHAKHKGRAPEENPRPRRTFFVS